MGSNIIELAKLGHERAAELKASCGAVDVRSLAQLISDLATQLEVQFVRSTNMAVQLANAESKCRELAAENACLKKFCKNAAFDADYEAELGMERGGFTDALNDIKTPATDAFLAEVRAQGVEMFADSLLCPDLDDTIREFADELRKGAAL
ncbi:hypothetical protein DOH07_20775 [Salmonella enterica subsp. enterica serovar Typhimurium]|nr:hypothetical protein [Salmonella enterica subsp. enterica serovar Typhimurium]EBV3467487.1 hypothetical protein [Salmonella enterica subsp. enterica serovar Typhimurium]EHX9194198.1 hypothetical protein [Salmonella enterica subsp. enterica serovar Typhimurium]